MARRTAKCKRCGKDLYPEERFKHNSKNYCKDCYDIVIREAEDYKNLIAYICEIFEIDKPSGFILKQIKNYKEEFGYGYAGMQYTLWYCREIENYDFILKYGIYMVKQHFEDAKDYYNHQEKMIEKMESLSEKDIHKVKRVDESSISHKPDDNSSLVNLTSLLSDNEEG